MLSRCQQLTAYSVSSVIQIFFECCEIPEAILPALAKARVIGEQKMRPVTGHFRNDHRNIRHEIDMAEGIVAYLLLCAFDADSLVKTILQSFLKRHRPPEIIALQLFTSGLFQVLYLFLCFHTLCQRPDSQLLVHFDHGTDDAAGTGRVTAKESHIQLEQIK